MHPILFKIGNFTFYTYGLIMAVAFFLSYIFLLHCAKIKGEDTELYSDLFFWVMIFGLLGSKLLYVFVDFREIVKSRDMVGCLRGGLVWYGGLLMDIAFIYYYARRKKLFFAKIVDVFSAPTALGLGIGRWGCLMAGCCYGKPTELPWAIVYPDAPIAHPMAGIPVHPSPVYESLGCFVISIICYITLRRSTRPGLACLDFFLFYAPMRFFLEFLRGDKERGFVIEGILSTSQFISIFVWGVAIYFFVKVLRKPLNEAHSKTKGKAKKDGYKKAQ